MPYTDPEKQKQANRESQRRSRSRKAGKPVSESAGSSGGFSPAVLVSVKDLDLSALAENIKAETDNLSHDGWLNLQGAMGLEILAIVRQALKSTMLVRSVKDVAQLLKLSQALIEPVISSRGNLGGEDGIPSDLHEVHLKMLAMPGAIEHANAMVQLLSEVMLKSIPPKPH